MISNRYLASQINNLNNRNKKILNKVSKISGKFMIKTIKINGRIRINNH
jgi:hypothetical protein